MISDEADRERWTTAPEDDYRDRSIQRDLERQWRRSPWSRPGWVHPMPPPGVSPLSVDEARARLSELRKQLLSKSFARER